MEEEQVASESAESVESREPPSDLSWIELEPLRGEDPLEPFTRIPDR